MWAWIWPGASHNGAVFRDLARVVRYAIAELARTIEAENEQSQFARAELAAMPAYLRKIAQDAA